MNSFFQIERDVTIITSSDQNVFSKKILVYKNPTAKFSIFMTSSLRVK